MRVVMVESLANEVTRSCETAQCDTEGCFRVSRGVKQVLWIPAEDEHLYARLMVCAHIRSCDSRGKVSTLQVLQPYCVRYSMKANMVVLVRQCLHCMDGKVGELKPLTQGKLIHGMGLVR